MNNIQNRILLHREGKPEDVAELVATLVENDRYRRGYDHAYRLGNRTCHELFAQMDWGWLPEVLLPDDKKLLLIHAQQGRLSVLKSCIPSGLHAVTTLQRSHVNTVTLLLGKQSSDKSEEGKRSQ